MSLDILESGVYVTTLGPSFQRNVNFIKLVREKIGYMVQ